MHEYAHISVAAPIRSVPSVPAADGIHVAQDSQQPNQRQPLGGFGIRDRYFQEKTGVETHGLQEARKNVNGLQSYRDPLDRFLRKMRRRIPAFRVQFLADFQCTVVELLMFTNISHMNTSSPPITTASTSSEQHRSSPAASQTTSTN
eukprot:CAMPEP_0174899902 /NCGR_PEP_ID=MMETSP0167-20121228/29062_1 /TAXON_ID=38298 /ORGANISM="Rhodella maculata, Strain CCMP736" /LENGTH=146 /DNA_ID=CAMNT_0016141065 /DNA_START=109 /DNA_END=547 /DNA_ORIENTATION=+